MLKHCVVSSLVLIGSLAAAVPLHSGQLNQLGRLLGGGSKPEYQTFKAPDGQFSFEYPKDWQIGPGAGDVIATFAQKKGEAHLVVERFHLRIPLGAADITDAFTEAEAEKLRESQPKASDIDAKKIDRNGQPMVVVGYNRVGLARPERARQYSFPVVQELYRLTCSAGTKDFAKYDAVFAHVADSFKVVTPTTTDGR